MFHNLNVSFNMRWYANLISHIIYYSGSKSLCLIWEKKIWGIIWDVPALSLFHMCILIACILDNINKALWLVWAWFDNLIFCVSSKSKFGKGYIKGQKMKHHLWRNKANVKTSIRVSILPFSTYSTCGDRPFTSAHWQNKGAWLENCFWFTSENFILKSARSN